MFKLINHIYTYILSFIRKDKKDTVHSKNPYVSQLSFYLTKKDEVDIEHVLPNIKDMSLEEVIYLSEKYAKFLMIINEGYLKEDIIQIIDEGVKKSEDPNDHLFWENVMVHWALLHVESLKNKKQKEKRDQPLIRPLYAFGTIET